MAVKLTNTITVHIENDEKLLFAFLDWGLRERVYQCSNTRTGGWRGQGGMVGHYDTKHEQAIREFFVRYQHPAEDGWIVWGGGDNPVDQDTIVEYVITKRDRVFTKRAATVDWKHRDNDPGQNVIAYRVIDPTKEEIIG